MNAKLKLELDQIVDKSQVLSPNWMKLANANPPVIYCLLKDMGQGDYHGGHGANTINRLGTTLLYFGLIHLLTISLIILK